MSASATETIPGALTLEALGPLRLRGAGDRLVGPRKELVLLTFIARRGKPVARAELAALLWGERPETNARQSLRQAVLRLKRELGEILIAGPDTVSLAPGALEFDVTVFEADLAAGRLADGVRRWRGELLAGADDAGGEEFRFWLEAEREGLRKRLIWALERLVRDAEARGEVGAALHWAELWADLSPTDQQGHTRLVELLRSAGRATDAAAKHASFAVRLRDDGAGAATPETQRLGEVLDRELHGSQARPRATSSAVLFTPDLVGRALELDALNNAFALASSGAPAMVVVEGEEGVGKTRLCKELIRLLVARAPTLVVLRARAGGQARVDAGAFARELLTSLADAPGLLGATPQALADISALIPSVRATVRELPEPRRERWALRNALAHTLEMVSEEQPVLVFADDFPRADDASRSLLLSVIANAGRARMLLLVTARSEELKEWLVGDPESQEALSDARRLRLEPLAVADVERLVGSMLDLPGADVRALASRVHAETGGNPFFVTETVTELVEEGHLALAPDGSWRLPPALASRPLPRPATVLGAVNRRLASLSPNARRLLASVPPGESAFDMHAVGSAANLSSETLYSALDELVGRRLIRETGSGSRKYEFTHDLIHRAAEHLRDSDSRPAPAGSPSERAAPRTRRMGWRLGIGAMAATAVAIAGWLMVTTARARATSTAPMIIAVAPITEYPAADSARVGAALADMLATNLSRLSRVQVVSNSLLYGRAYGAGSSAGSGNSANPMPGIMQVARAAGASNVLEGVLYHRPGGALRLDLRRVEIGSGAVRSAFTLEGTDPFVLVDSATSLIAASLEVAAVPLRVADVSTSSIEAYRLYARGLGAYYERGDAAGADLLFSAALAVDSTFAMAAYYEAIVSPAVGGPAYERMQAAEAKADHASAHERLLIRTAAAMYFNDPAVLALADSLVARYPADPSGHYFVGAAKSTIGDFLAAVPHLARAVDMDSLAFRGGSIGCRACDAISAMVLAYWNADSLPAADRVAHDWVRRQPRSPTAWYTLAAVLKQEGKNGEALAADDSVAQFGAGPAGDDRNNHALVAVYDGDYARADHLLRDLIRDGPPRATGWPLGLLSTSLRAQGRLGEALRTTQRLRVLAQNGNPAAPISRDAQLTAQVLLESGHPRASAAIWDSLMVLVRNLQPPYTRGLDARGITWFLAHLAEARAAAGDTVGLERLADSIEVIGRRSLYGRDRVIHHHVRGLLAVARGNLTAAATEFRAAIYSPTLGFTRTNLDLARTRLALHQPREAVGVLQSALRGVLDASNSYVTRTELHEALAQAFDQSGQRDSAVAEYRLVVNAWSSADPVLQPRVAVARQRLAVLTRRATAAGGARPQGHSSGPNKVLAVSGKPNVW